MNDQPYRVIEFDANMTATAVTYTNDYDEAKRLHDTSRAAVRMTQRRDPVCNCGWCTASATYR